MSEPADPRRGGRAEDDDRCGEGVQLHAAMSQRREKAGS
jgi:hypothetical protein